MYCVFDVCAVCRGLTWAATMGTHISLVLFNIRAKGVKGADKGGKSSDPYLEVTVGKEKKKTPHIKETLNPVWTGVELTFGGEVQNLETISRVDMQLFDKDITVDDKIGTCSVSFDELWRQGNNVYRYVTRGVMGWCAIFSPPTRWR